MRILVLLTTALISTSSISANSVTSKSLDFYQDSTCEEMTNKHSEDTFIRFAAKEITSYLGENICSRVQSIESLENDELPLDGEISAVQFGKLIESIHILYSLKR